MQAPSQRRSLAAPLGAIRPSALVLARCKPSPARIEEKVLLVSLRVPCAGGRVAAGLSEQLEAARAGVPCRVMVVYGGLIPPVCMPSVDGTH